VKPELAKNRGLAASSASFEFSDQGGEGGDWQLRLLDSQGKALRTLRGKGRPPKGLRWDGLDESGQPALLEAGSSYEMRVTDGSGKSGQWKEDLATARDLDGFAGQEALLSRLGDQDTCFKDGTQPGCLRCQVHFPFAEDTVGERGRAEMLEIRRLVTGARLAEMRVEGHADSLGESGQNVRISQARADAVLDFMLDKLDVQANLATALGMGDKHPVDGKHDEKARARNRRVEILLKF